MKIELIIEIYEGIDTFIQYFFRIDGELWYENKLDSLFKGDPMGKERY